MSSKSKKSKGKSSKKAPGPFTAAGLVRFYEEADVGIKLKPHVVIIVMILFVAIVIAVSKLYPIQF